MIRRAAIYIRVSSERQAEKASPQAQEAECRAYCEQKGYAIVEVYRDVEKYRVGQRMVEPSGTRPDRPQMRRMLADADTGKFDVIIAWREDRLYRGLRPMLEVIECIERSKVDIELVKESFDPKMAGIKATIAKMELDAKHERMALGVKARLASGKTWNNCTPYGYKLVDGRLDTDQEQAQWVRRIFAWYAGGVPTREIRQRLIFNNAPQQRRKSDGVAWGQWVIYCILDKSCYHTGVQQITWDSQTFDIPAPVLIDADTVWRVAKRRKMGKSHPARNVKHMYLGMGLIYCKACGWKMHAITATKRGSSSYRCSKLHWQCASAGCARSIGAKKLDGILWEKVWKAVSDDEYFEQRVQAKIAALQSQEQNAEAEVERLHHVVEELTMERQRIITWARKGSITGDDMEMQLGALAIQETELRKDFEEKSLLIGNHAQRLMDFANRYRETLRTGAEFLTCTTETPEAVQKQFELRRQIIEAVVKRIDVVADKAIEVQFEMDLVPGEQIKDMRGCSFPER